MIEVKGKDLDGNEITTQYTRYTVIAWVLDKRYADDCRIETFNTEDLDEAKNWVSKLKKAWGDSVELHDRETGKTEAILLRDDQRVD